MADKKKPGKKLESELTLEERFVGKVVQYCPEKPVVVNRFNPAPGPKRGPFTTTHDVLPAVVVAIDKSGKANLKVLALGGKGAEQIEGVELSEKLLRPKCWSPDGVTEKAKPKAESTQPEQPAGSA